MKKRIALIAAMSENRVIGRGNRLPWQMPADWENFRKITHDKPFIMGRNSFVAEDRLLSTYKSVILSHHTLKDLPPNCQQAHTIKESLELLAGEPEIFILGGQHIFEQTLHIANYLYLTIVHTVIDGDTFFPEFDHTKWRVMNNTRFSKDDENPFDYSFIEYQRKSRIVHF